MCLAIFLIQSTQEFDFTLVYVSLLNFCKAWWRSNAGFLLICAWMIMIPFSTASHLYCAFNGRYSHILLRLDQTGSAMTPEIIEHIFPPSQLRLQIRPFELGNVETAKSGGKTAKDTLFASLIRGCKILFCYSCLFPSFLLACKEKH